MRIAVIITLLSILPYSLFSQNIPEPKKAKDRLASFEKRKALIEKSVVNEIEFRSVGPSVMSGRVTDIAVDPNDAMHFYVAYASGGLWETKNNGMSFQAIFDNEAVMSIGDIAVNWKDSIIWVGTGENNSSRSSYSGLGIYKSFDNGVTWKNMGLYDSHHIGRIVLHPSNPDIVWIAALGHLYSKNTERGIFKTVNGGKTWKKTLYVNDNTGAIDLIADPKNENVLYASLWERDRKAWNFTESGKGSGIYKSADAGDSWTKLSTKESGFPIGDGIGRIGLAVSYQNSDFIYAFIDNQFHREEKAVPAGSQEESDELLTKDEIRKLSKDEFLELENKKIDSYLKKYNFPKEYNVQLVKEMIETGQILPVALVDFVHDANAALFGTPVTGAEVYKSINGGKTWLKTHENYLDDIYYTYGYYFGEIRVSPFNENEIYIMGVPLLKSDDGGKTFYSIGKSNVHSDHQALWVSPTRKGHLINGNDGGLNISFDDGETWFNANTSAVGQFYSVNYDMSEPYNVYGGLQDNGVWYGPSTYKASPEWHSSGHYPYKRLIGGDGMQVEIDSRDNKTIYTGSQFGYYSRINLNTMEYSSIKPSHKLGEKSLRFNWQSPIHLSKHNEDILYFGSNKFHRSMDQGKNFETLSGDLTNGMIKGDVSYGTLTTIHESPLRFGLIYVGSDDGLVHKSTNGGYSWTNISEGLPENYWISRVIASTHYEKVVYVSLNAYRWDNFEALVYRSTDYGKTWKQIGLDLPNEPVNVIKEDPANQNIIYIGTDHGLYVSLDWGDSFMAMNNGLPAVAVHDLVIHPRDNDLILGTHGRSIYIAAIDEMQLLADSIYDKEIHLFDIKPVNYKSNWGKAWWSKWYGFNEPEIKISFWSNKKDSLKLSIIDKNKMVLYDSTFLAVNGLNFMNYDLTIKDEIVESYVVTLNEEAIDSVKITRSDNSKYYLRPGEYFISLKMDDLSVKKQFIIKETE